MKTIAADFQVKDGFRSSGRAFRAELPNARRFVRPLPVVAGLPEPSCAAEVRPRAHRRVRSIWMPPEGDHLGEKLMLVVLVGAAVLGIVHGFTFLIEYVENSALIHQAMARLLQ